MNIGMYSVYDKKANSYGQPFFAANDECATRIVISSLSESSQLVLYPSDFALCRVGSFDDGSGCVTCDTVSHLANIAVIVPKKFHACALDGSYDQE